MNDLEKESKRKRWKERMNEWGKEINDWKRERGMERKEEKEKEWVGERKKKEVIEGWTEIKN